MQRRSLPRVVSPVVLFIALCAASAIQAQGWRGAGRAKGVILDPAGNAVKGAQVTILWAENEGGGPAAVKSDEKGRWSFVGLVAGSWEIKVDAPGFQPFEDEFVVYGGGAPETLRATLTPIPKEELEAQAKAEKLAVINAALGEGNRLAGAGDYEAARTAYQRALGEVEEPAKKAEILAAIASTFAQEQKPADSVQYLEQALAIDAKNETALRLMVSVLAAQGRDEEAKQYLARLPDEQSLDASTQLNLGIMRYNEGKLEEAGAIFDRVLAQHPDRAEAYYFSGLVKLNQEQHAAALERFQKFLELAPQHEKAAEAREFVAHLEQMAAKKP
jgi:lipopolysaccharide biosynthesis regulator YciM